MNPEASHPDRCVILNHSSSSKSGCLCLSSSVCSLIIGLSACCLQIRTEPAMDAVPTTTAEAAAAAETSQNNYRLVELRPAKYSKSDHYRFISLVRWCCNNLTIIPLLRAWRQLSDSPYIYLVSRQWPLDQPEQCCQPFASLAVNLEHSSHLAGAPLQFSVARHPQVSVCLLR